MYLTIRNIPILFLLLAVLSNGVFSQTKEKDTDDALKLSQSFSSRMRKIQDFEPLLKEFFVEDIVQNSFKANRSDGFDLIEPGLWPKLDRKLQRRYFLAVYNWIYLATMHSCSTAWDKEPEPNTFLPPEVRRVIKKNTLFKRWLGDYYPAAKSVRQLTQFIRTVERIIPMYRRRLTSLNRMSDQQFTELLGKCGRTFGEFFGVVVYDCSEYKDCGGLPNSGRIVTVDSPLVFIFDTVRVDGQMKVVRAAIQIGD